MNLDKRCPNPHFMDANCTCEKPFIPASEKEYPSHAHAGISTGNCPICSTTETLDWMDKEREAFMESSHVEASYDDQIGLQVISSPEDVCDYWILRIEEARKEGYEKGFDAGGQTKGGTGRIMYQRGLEQGKQEEKARIVKMIEENFASFNLMDWSGESEVYDEIERLKNQLLDNLKKDE